MVEYIRKKLLIKYLEGLQETYPNDSKEFDVINEILVDVKKLRNR